MPDIGRFFNIDPLAEKYLYNSPYAFSENKVVAHRELEGLESHPVNPIPMTLDVPETQIHRTGSKINVMSQTGNGEVVNSTRISLPSSNTQTEITDKSAKVIGEIAMSSNESDIRISRIKTDAPRQAGAMFDNLIGKGKGQGLINQRALYNGKPGIQVISTFVKGKALQGMASQFGGTVTNGQVKDMMAGTIGGIGLEKVTNHAQENPNINAIDVAPSSIDPSNQATFQNAASSHPDVHKLIPPPRDPAFHIEVKQNR